MSQSYATLWMPGTPSVPITDSPQGVFDLFRCKDVQAVIYRRPLKPGFFKAAQSNDKKLFHDLEFAFENYKAGKNHPEMSFKKSWLKEKFFGKNNPLLQQALQDIVVLGKLRQQLAQAFNLPVPADYFEARAWEGMKPRDIYTYFHIDPAPMHMVVQYMGQGTQFIDGPLKDEDYTLINNYEKHRFNRDISPAVQEYNTIAQNYTVHELNSGEVAFIKGDPKGEWGLKKEYTQEEKKNFLVHASPPHMAGQCRFAAVL